MIDKVFKKSNNNLIITLIIAQKSIADLGDFVDQRSIYNVFSKPVVGDFYL